MKTSLLATALGLLTLVSAESLVGRALSSDGTCGLKGAGANKGYTCGTGAAGGGLCCSTNGWCGSTDAYCGTGCQAGYGQCGALKTTTAKTTMKTTGKTTAPTITKTAAAPSGTSTLNCGPAYGNQVCANGLCCSQYGWCKNDAAHCDAGCQPKFGTCSASSSPPATTTIPSGSSTYYCGPNHGGQVCLQGLCCGPEGTCNNDSEHCNAGCQPEYGECGTQTAQKPGPTGSTLNCGPSYGNAVCAPGYCCSAGGWCGKTEEYCTDPFECQFGYGDCDSSKTPKGKSTASDPRPRLGHVTYTDDIYDCTAPNVVALTYDDGPREFTEHLLDELKAAGFHATFFVTGNNFGKGMIDVTAPWPSLIKRMIAEGHQVASHTWSHYDLGGLKHTDRMAQMVKNERAIANIIGKYPTYMRPPYSSCQSDCMKDMEALGYHRVYFDLDSQDYLNDAPNEIQKSKDIMKNAMHNLHNGQDMLVIQHDVHEQTVYNLTSYTFDLIKQKGWKGVSVGECLQDPKENWYRIPGTGKGTS